LGTRSHEPEELYRALIEATAFGTRTIVEAFESQASRDSIVAGGGLTHNRMLMQLYADVLQREIAVAGAEQVSALGAAMLGAVAAGCYPSVAEAASHMAPPPREIYPPNRDPLDGL